MSELLSAFSRRDWEAADADEPLRIAIVGFGGYARNFAVSAIDRSPSSELSVVVSSAATADELPASVPNDQLISYDAYREGELADDYDAVYVATPNARHLELVEAAAELGKDVLVEKPMERSPERCRRMISACSDAGVTLMVGYRTRFDPVFRGLRRRLPDLVGEVRQVHTGFSMDLLGQNPDTDQWRLDADLAGGGALTDLGVYPINTIRYLLDADPVEVAATSTSVNEAFDDVEEHIAVQFTFEEGQVAVCTASYGAAFDSHLRIVGTEGVVSVTPGFFSDDAREIRLERGGERATVSPDRTSELTEEFEYFASRVLADEPVETDGHDGLADVRIMRAAYESVERGTTVSISDEPSR